MSDTFHVDLERLEGYAFRASFDGTGVPPLVVDEPPPLGQGRGPGPARLLAAAVGSCLSASLLFSLTKRRVEVRGIEASVEGTFRRNERQRLRVGRLDVVLELDAPGADADAVAGAIRTFEDFCVVTASVRRGIDVSVKVVDPDGHDLSRPRSVPEPTAG